MNNNIEQFSEQLGISQDQLAILAGISQDELNDIENGRVEPSLMAAYKITKALKKDFIADVFLMDDLDI